MGIQQRKSMTKRSQIRIIWNPNPSQREDSPTFHGLAGGTALTPVDLDYLAEAWQMVRDKYGSKAIIRAFYRYQPGDYAAVCCPGIENNIIQFPGRKK